MELISLLIGIIIGVFAVLIVWYWIEERNAVMESKECQ